jgi:hypothetical protein
MRIREPAVVVGKYQQQQQSRGASGQLHKEVWDPGGFQQQSRGAHEKEIRIFPTMEYDSGASFPPQ